MSTKVNGKNEKVKPQVMSKWYKSLGAFLGYLTI